MTKNITAAAPIEWETFEGESHGYNAAGDRVIDITARVRETSWTRASNVRGWAVLGNGIDTHGVLASGKANGLREAKKAALAALAAL